VRVLVPAAIYFALVFAAGFALGAVRTLLVAPATGPFIAVALELPLMLAVSWQAWSITARRFPLRSLPDAVAVGAIAFALLMAAETMLGLALGRGLAAQTAALATPSGLLGLYGQAIFAILPAIRP
jgi:hypothetical protein